MLHLIFHKTEAGAVFWLTSLISKRIAGLHLICLGRNRYGFFYVGGNKRLMSILTKHSVSLEAVQYSTSHVSTTWDGWETSFLAKDTASNTSELYKTSIMSVSNNNIHWYDNLCCIVMQWNKWTKTLRKYVYVYNVVVGSDARRHWAASVR